MCKFRLPRAIVSDKGTMFSSAMIFDFCRDLVVQKKFMFVIDPQANGQAELKNKVILKGLKKKLNDAKGLRAELLHEILWLYHTIHYSTTKETPIAKVNGADTILLVKIDTPSRRHSQAERVFRFY